MVYTKPHTEDTECTPLNVLQYEEYSGSLGSKVISLGGDGGTDIVDHTKKMGDLGYHLRYVTNRCIFSVLIVKGRHGRGMIGQSHQDPDLIESVRGLIYDRKPNSPLFEHSEVGFPVNLC